MASAAVYQKRPAWFLPAHGCLLLLTGLLSACSIWPRSWFSSPPLSYSQAQYSASDQAVEQAWVVQPDKLEELKKVYKGGKLLVVPVMEILPSGELLPDYIRTAKLYDQLSKGGLKLLPGKNSLLWHHRFVAAVEQTCPQNAVNPLSSCISRGWASSFMPGEGSNLYDSDVIFHFLDQQRTNYLIVPDLDLYKFSTVRSLRYAPSSAPLINMALAERVRQLAPLKQEVSLVIVKVRRNWLGNIVAWDGELARCQLSLPEGELSLDVLRHARPVGLDKLREYCLPRLSKLLM